MKNILFLCMSLCFTTTAFSQQATGKYAGTYEFRFPGTNLSHYIIIKNNGGQLTGKYLGCEAGNDTLYYSASMKSLEIGNDGKIAFKLKSFRLSPTALRPGHEELTPEGQDDIRKKIMESGKANTALFITGGYSFSGTIGKKNMQLRRVADQYDNAADQMKFTRIAN